jgi:hypothetical protein
MSLRECQDRIDSREFSQWQAYWHFNPFGEEPRMLAQISAILVNANRDPKSSAVGVDEMLPVARPRLPEPPQDPAETRANLRASLGGS